MHTTNCDKCGKKKDAKTRGKWTDISISGGDFSYNNFDFCEKCGNKIIEKILRIIKTNK